MTETDTIPELLPLAIAPPAFMPDPSEDDAPPGQAGTSPSIDIDYPDPPAGDRTQVPPYPQGRLTDPIQRWEQPHFLADPIDRQVHYYGSLIDRADDYKAINGHDPSGNDLAYIQAHARAEAFPPGETPLARFANTAATPVAASAPIAAGPPMSDTGEAAPAGSTPAPAPSPTAVADPPAAPADAPPQGQAAPPDAKTEAPAVSPPSQPQTNAPIEGDRRHRGNRPRAMSLR